MGTLAKRVAARWGYQVALGDWQPEIPSWVVPWSERMARQARWGPPEVGVPTSAQEVFDAAKLSIEILLPKALSAFRRKFHGDRFYMNATQQRMKLYYYFSTRPALETFTLMLSIRGGLPLLSFGYVPHKPLSGADFKRSITETAFSTDPELAGLTFMRLVRKVLGQI